MNLTIKKTNGAWEFYANGTLKYRGEQFLPCIEKATECRLYQSVKEIMYSQYFCYTNDVDENKDAVMKVIDDLLYDDELLYSLIYPFGEFLEEDYKLNKEWLRKKSITIESPRIGGDWHDEVIDTIVCYIRYEFFNSFDEQFISKLYRHLRLFIMENELYGYFWNMYEQDILEDTRQTYYEQCGEWVEKEDMYDILRN